MRPSVLDALRSGAVFATLLGALPHPPLPPDADPHERLRAAVRAQADAGLEPVTDGREPPGAGSSPGLVAAWREAAAVAGSTALKQAVVGPWSSAGRDRARGSAEEAAASLRGELESLAAAGCPLVEIHEPSIVGRPFDDTARAAVAAAWRRLLDGIADQVHVSLALSGGDVVGFGPAIYDAPFSSYAFDLRAGPDNWRVIADAPRDRGIVVGALATAEGSDDGPELLVWAAHYAASIGGRGLDRVGLATAGSLAHLEWDAAERKMRRLGDAARIAALGSFAEIAPQLDPPAAGMKSAALGRHVSPRRRHGRPPTRSS
jgi:methionine synthase II (cobalamin-independent)